jgi:hypothetical protein
MPWSKQSTPGKHYGQTRSTGSIVRRSSASREVWSPSAYVSRVAFCPKAAGLSDLSRFDVSSPARALRDTN